MALTEDKKHFPISDADNAYDLLTDIAHLAMDEPERLAMGTWLDVETPFRAVVPSCGTVGCIGGWTEALTMRKSTKKLTTHAYGRFVLNPKNTAQETLGLNTTQVEELFYDSRLCSMAEQQTCGHARAVKAHIEKFQAKYSRQLKAKKL